jgi:dihydroorotate dehydrogenase electron transfer subunit
VHVRVPGGGCFLRRPISIHALHPGGRLDFIFQAKGPGTALLAGTPVGAPVNLLGPLGDGVFETQGCAHPAIVGGGIGVFPLFELARRLPGAAVYLGFRSKSLVVLEEAFRSLGNPVTLCTDDGSHGRPGPVTNALRADFAARGGFDRLFGCGPLPLLRALSRFAQEEQTPCQISLEERMACGLGACVGCSVRRAGQNGYARVCKDGPVFWAQDVAI